MNDFQFNIIIALIPVLGLILTTIVGNVAKKYGENLDLNAASFWAKIAVSIFEDRYGKGKGDEKKQDVIKFLKERGINLSENQIELLIEAVVKELTIAGVINRDSNKMLN